MPRHTEHHAGDQAPNLSRRRGLKAAGFVALAYVTDGLAGAAWDASRPHNGTTIEHDKISTPHLALVMGGIGRQNGNDITSALAPSLANKNTTLTSLVYPDRAPSPKETANAILATNCKNLTIVGHSSGACHGLFVIAALRPAIESGQINKPRVVMLNSPYTGEDVISPLAKPISYVPLGLGSKSLLDLVVYGEVKDVAVGLEEAQLDLSVDFDGSTVLPNIADLIDAAIYVGDAYPDGVINTPQAAQGYAQSLGNRLTVQLVPGLGHPDPAKDPRQAAIYNEVIADWHKALAA